MAEPAPVSIPWLDDFERDPAEAVDNLLRGVAEVSPYERAGAADVLVTLFGGLAENDRDRRLALDKALGNWLEARHLDGPTVRREHGVNRYVEELIQALTAVYRLRLTGIADRLRAGFGSYLNWLRSFALGPGQDSWSCGGSRTWCPRGTLGEALVNSSPRLTAFTTTIQQIDAFDDTTD